MLVARTDIPPGMEAWQVARKSVVTCISDLYKGVRPYAAVISLGIPTVYSMRRPNIEGLANGFAIASKEFESENRGGDTNESLAELVIDCGMIGFPVFKVPTRSGAKPGDYVIVSGAFGLAPVRSGNSVCKTQLQPAPYSESV